MPAAEGMQIITGRFSRRAMLVGAIASIPVAGGALAAPALLEKQIPVQKVNRLAAELADAMDEWMTSISHPDYRRALWVAHVWPATWSAASISGMRMLLSSIVAAGHFRT